MRLAPAEVVEQRRRTRDAEKAEGEAEARRQKTREAAKLVFSWASCSGRWRDSCRKVTASVLMSTS